jgi:hypothetical protein
MTASPTSMTGPATTKQSMALEGPLAGWFERAGVRHDPHHLVADLHAPSVVPGGGNPIGDTEASGIEAQLRAGKTFFPLALMPHLTHPIVQALPPDRMRALAARHLYQYLTFTAQFESQVVNRATAQIAAGDTDIDLPIGARVDALKIYTDEGWHALCSLDLVAQLAAATRIPALPYDFRPYLARLDAVGADLLPGRPLLAQLLQVVVFETLVTSILSAVPADPTVLDVVRETVADHARDEGRHHAYFSAFFRELWAGLATSERTAAAQCLPQLIRRSLEPDLTATRATLLAAGLGPQRADTVLADSFPAEGRGAEIARSAKHSIRLFRNCGVLDVPGGRDAFASAGLLDDPSGVR